MKLALELDADRIAPGDQLAGRIVVLEGGPSRSLTLGLGFHERTRDMSALAFSYAYVVHEGGLVSGQSVAFDLTLPADAPPNVKGEHSELCWELDVTSDQPGFDARVQRRLDVTARRIASFARFGCAECGQEAGSMALAGSELRRESFTGVLTQPVAGATLEQLRAALALGSAGAVFVLDAEYAPFYCPTCAASYCGAHWQRLDVFDDDEPSWRDSIRGRCPRGHERMLED